MIAVVAVGGCGIIVDGLRQSVWLLLLLYVSIIPPRWKRIVVVGRRMNGIGMRIIVMMGCSIHVVCDMSFVAMGIVMRIGSVHCLLCWLMKTIAF